MKRNKLERKPSQKMFKDPMERLSNALHSLRSSTLKDRNKDYCNLNEALNQFNVIATMTTHGEHVEMIKEEDFDNVVDINTNKENNEKEEDEESMKEYEDDKKKEDHDSESEESYDAFGPEYGTDKDNDGLENPVGNTEDDRHEKENDPKDKGQNTLNNADEKEADTKK